VTAVRLRIDRVAVELAEDLRADEVAGTMRDALQLLASRLATAPLGKGKEAPQRALELLEVGPVANDWLAGPGAAARLADELYEQIVRAS
jgi:hypothetical protein